MGHVRSLNYPTSSPIFNPMKFFLVLCLLAVAFSGTCNRGSQTLELEELTTLDFENTLEEATLDNTGGTIIKDGSIWGQWVPDASSRGSFDNTVERVTEKAQTVSSAAQVQQCLIDGRAVEPYCLIDCKVDYRISNCKAKVAMFKTYFDEMDIIKKYCIQPRLDAIKAGTLQWSVDRCYTESCPCRNFKDAILNYQNGKVYQARMYARVTAYQQMCKSWCATGVAPQRTYQ